MIKFYRKGLTTRNSHSKSRRLSQFSRLTFFQKVFVFKKHPVFGPDSDFRDKITPKLKIFVRRLCDFFSRAQITPPFRKPFPKLLYLFLPNNNKKPDRENQVCFRKPKNHQKTRSWPGCAPGSNLRFIPWFCNSVLLCCWWFSVSLEKSHQQKTFPPLAFGLENIQLFK